MAHDASDKSGANPLDSQDPIKTKNFNKIILVVFVCMVLALILSIVLIKFV